MELSIIVARVLAIFYVAAGVGVLRGAVTHDQILEDFRHSPALTFITGFITIIFGALLTSYHNVWVADWTVLITLIGWIALVKGILFLAFPQVILKFKPWFKNTRPWGLMMIALGILFGYFGF